MFRVDASGLVSDLHRIGDELNVLSVQAVGQAAEYAAAHARASTKFKDKSGALRKTIRRGVRSSGASFVQAGDRRVKWALFVEEDTKAHEIRPKLGAGFIGPARPGQRRSGGAAKPVLRFRINGRWVSAKRVKHPGTTGTHFMQDARDAAEVKLFRFVEDGVNRIVR